MKSFTSLLIVALCNVITYAKINSVENLTAYRYHERVGIPLAEKIKKNEEDAIKAGLTGQRIVGGSIIDISQVPFQAGLVIQFPGFTSVCGASLISNTRLVTAAHCQWDGQLSALFHTVVLGSNFVFSGGVRIVTQDTVMHPNWTPWTLANDIAVMRIPFVSFTNVIQPISLPSGNELSQTFAGQIGTASGFGFTSNDGGIPQNQRISFVNVPIITNVQCRAYFGPFAHDTNICINGAGGIGTCFGDSGGPLTAQSSGRRILVGVSSYIGYSGCDGGTPAGFARVTSFVPWILSV